MITGAAFESPLPEWAGPLAWGQRSIWGAMRQVGPPGDRYFNFTRTVPVPKGAGALPPEAVARAVAMVAARHDSLRTRVRLDGGGEPYQVVGSAGAIPVEVADEAEESAGRLAERLAGIRFEPAEDWPLRAGVVTRDGAARHVVLTFCHVAADGHAGDVVARDLRLALLRGAVPGRPAQLRDLVARQDAEDKSRSDRAVDFWEHHMRDLGGPLFDIPADTAGSARGNGHGNTGTGPVAEDGRDVGRGDAAAGFRYQRAALVSPALDRASRVLAARYGVSTSTVLLTAACARSGLVAGRPAAAMTPLVNNRFRPGDRDLVTSLAQLGLFALTPGDLDRPFHDLMTTARGAALRAYRHAYYDQAELNRRLAGADPLCCFNDQRPVDGVTPAGELADAGDIRAALPLTEHGPESGLDDLNCRFCVHVTGEPGRLRLMVTADTRYVAPADLGAFLPEVERLVVDAAIG
ncbi:condensation domain-containing protein [Microbispora sp. NPDC049125]|uniref:condensation domain-containing protein n=1 Tax=Microbispora sp. NPDC049125 TaxID=3154929 RepID=UPI003465AA6F